MTRKSCFIVVSMHRSGTSAIANLLSRIGCAAPKNLFDADSHNQKGYWEPASIVALNDKVLEFLNLNWRSLSNTQHAVDKAGGLDGFRGAARAAFWDEFSRQEMIVLKDPRISLLLKFWSSIVKELKYDIVYVVPVRPPAEVAASLAERDAIPPSYAVALWLKYMLETERQSRGGRRVFCHYSDLLNNRRSTIDRIAAVSDQGFSIPSDLDSEADRIIEPALQHFRQADQLKALSNRGMKLVESAYAILSKWSTNEEDQKDYAELDKIYNSFEKYVAESSALFSDCNELIATFSKSKCREANLNELLVSRNSQNDADRSALRQAWSDLEALRKEFSEFQASSKIEHSKLDLKASELQAKLEVTLEQKIDFQNRCDVLVNELQTSRAERDRALDRLNAVTDEMRGARQALAENQRILMFQSAECENLRNSSRANSENLSTALNELSQAQALLMSSENRCAELSQTVSEVSAQIPVLERELGLVRTASAQELSASIARARDLEAECLQLQREARASANQLDFILNRNAELIQQHDSATSAVEIANEKLNESLSELGRERVKVDALMAEINTIKEYVTLLENKLILNVGENQLLSAKFQALQDNFATCEATIFNNDKEIRLLAARYDAAVHEVLSMLEAISPVGAEGSKNSDTSTPVSLMASEIDLSETLRKYRSALEIEKQHIHNVYADIAICFVSVFSRNITKSPLLFGRKFIDIKSLARALSEANLFDEPFYLEANQDVASAGVSPTMHWLLHGVRESRPIKIVFPI